MVFGFLKGEKANIEVQLDRPAGLYYPGDVIHATVTIHCETSVKVRAARAALVFWEHYEYRSQDSDGDISTSWSTVEEPAVTHSLMAEGTIPSGFRETYRLDFAIPQDAPPPYNGKITQDRWLVKVTLDRPMKGDINQEVEVPLIVPPSEPEPGRYGNASHPGEADMKFSLPSLDWVEGENISGTLRVEPSKDLGVNAVRLELVRREYVPHDKGNSAEFTEAKVELAGKTEFRGGALAEFPFEVAIPMRGCPSRSTGQSRVTWTLQASLNRRLAKDFTVTQNLFVHNGRR